eukprot:4298045-Prymnesium_polylepis.1
MPSPPWPWPHPCPHPRCLLPVLQATNLNLEKVRVKLELKMHLMHKAAIKKAYEKEQRTGEVSVAEDLRAVYLTKRERAKEAVELRRRLSVLRTEQKEEDEAEAEARAAAEMGAGEEECMRLVTIADVNDVLAQTRRRTSRSSSRTSCRRATR